MRIDFNQSGQEVSDSNRRAASPPTASTGTEAGGGLSVSADQAQLSGVHVLVQALAARAAQLPEVRQEKVSALRQAVQSGDYRPNPEQVADALLSHASAGGSVARGSAALGEPDRRASQEWATAI